VQRVSLVTEIQAAAAAKRSDPVSADDGATAANRPSSGDAGVQASGLPWVLYDGQCPMCSREISHYRRVRGADRVAWIDVADPSTPMPIDGVSRNAAMAAFHVRDADGRWLTGADGFAELWSHLRGYRHLALAVRRLHLLPLMNRAYRAFARWRIARQCESGHCMAADPNTSARKGNPSP
jgi:predicted DCC family thiol-disulfide oxidoreductase YuxK